MRKYLTIKNALLTIIVATIYYKSVFADVSMFVRFIATIMVFAGLMGFLHEADNYFMEVIEYAEESKNRRE